MKKKTIVLAMMILMLSVTFTGCFGMGGSAMNGAQPTIPPQKEYTSMDELAAAVKSAKADAAAADAINLKELDYLYELKPLPEGAQISYIKVAKDVIRIGYAFGATNKENFDNQMEIVWYRTAKADDFLTSVAKSLTDYDSIATGALNYLHTIPNVQLIVTASPGTSPEATPTPKTMQYCQIVYWVQDGVAFMSAVPLGFTNEQINKHCIASKVDLK